MALSPEQVMTRDTGDGVVVVIDGDELRRGWRAKITRPIVGVALAAAGVLAILLGYLGVAHETLVAKQIPYLVSGGIGGMVLVAVGAFLLGTYDVRQQLERVENLESMVTDLHDALLRAKGGTAAPEGGSSAQPIITAQGRNGAATGRLRAATSNGVVALPKGKSYHRAECTMVAGKRPEVVGIADIAARGLAPCPLCDPVPAETTNL